MLPGWRASSKVLPKVPKWRLSDLVSIMPHRIKKRQLLHDQKVRQVARELRQAGYFVRADLPGHRRPPVVGGIRPDIYAHRQDGKLVYEIETPESLATDAKQRQQLAKGAEKIGAQFKVVVA